MRPRDLVRLCLVALLGLMSAAVTAGTYNPLETFAPFDPGQAPSVYRSADGRPGPQYWQNRADYTIRARLDPASHVISGTVEIRYTNNSPLALSVLWLNLEQNRYRPDLRGILSGGTAPLGLTEGMTLDSAKLIKGKSSVALHPLISDTRAQISLPSPLLHGRSAVLRIDYHYSVPKDPWVGRTGWMDGPRGPIYSVAQWYPRMAVYDDIRGWDPLPYLAQEFYLEYGDFDYSVTVPANWIVAGSGGLANEREVLSEQERARLARARRSDRTVMIRAANEPFGSASGTKTWRFTMHDSRDVAFAASPAFVWDAARIRLPGGKSALAEFGLSARGQSMGSLDRIYERRGRALFLALVPLSVAGRDQRRRPSGRHGISGHRLR